MKLNEERKETLRYIGNMCKEFRNIIGYTMKDVSIETNIPEHDISNFERGFSNNAILYHWYIEKSRAIRKEQLFGNK